MGLEISRWFKPVDASEIETAAHKQPERQMRSTRASWALKSLSQEVAAKRKCVQLLGLEHPALHITGTACFSIVCKISSSVV